ncbi:serpin B [Haloactinospora alba]|uniref:Serpin B n=1 Tax=Haloactinospora alba TaxID=405555 RepID=A0A543NJ93_9ACTN|nr:serpin family protein [Haloactinospora alba]TQN31935.1 serpin B [Haloactinospora alba]
MPAPRSDHLDFALLLDGRLSDSGSSTVWSPHSVAYALGTLAAGARGGTRAELTRLLGAKPREHLAALDDAVADGPELAAGTGLWVREELPLNPGFEAELRQTPGAAVHTADFHNDAEGARHTINADVARATRGMITELLTSGTVTAATQALLVNALWVRLRWRHPFDPGRTAPAVFHAPSGDHRTPMMRYTGRLPHSHTAGWRMVTLTGEHELALDLLLPDDTTGFPPRLEHDALTALYERSSPTEVELTLPRFEAAQRAELSGPLAGCGVRTVFGDRADLSGVSEVPLRIDEVIHQARLRVDEHGAEGAAATAVAMQLAAVTRSRPVVFRADRPFRFVLRRRSSVLFLGTVAAPRDPGTAE